MALNGSSGAAADLLAFLDEVDATLDTYTNMMRMRPLETTSGKDFADWLGPYTDPGEHWSYATVHLDDGSLRAIATTTTDIGPETPLLFPFTETHQTMVMWWLTAAWRARQLIEATRLLAERELVVPVAACARGLVETAAQLHADAVKVAGAWDALKKSTDPARVGETSTTGRLALMQILNEATAGGKFDDKVPTLQEAYGRFNRANVLTAVQKLTKAYGATWQEDYQWLCNVAHPSVGNYFAFSSPASGHESGTHIVVGFSGQPIAVTSAEGTERVQIIDTAISRAIARSARALLTTLDDALRILDDVALSTKAAEIATFSYWRAIEVRDNQALCPCRSRRRAYRCAHQFGQPGPAVRAVPGDTPA